MEKRRKAPRVFEIDELDGFYVDRELDRTVYITFESREEIVIDIFNTQTAAFAPVGKVVQTIKVNLKGGEKIERNRQEISQGEKVPRYAYTD